MDMDMKCKSVNKKQAWKEFANGNEDYFEHVFRSFYKPLHAYGVKLSNQPALVRDCIHDLFENIWRRRSILTHIHSPNVYLFVSLRRKILKKVTRKKEIDNFNKVDESDFMNFNCEEIIIKDEIKFQQKRELKNALNQLSDCQKEVIYLHFYNGMSYAEIEKILSIKRQSVCNHIYRAMQTLRSLLDTEIMKLVVSLLLCFLFCV